MSIFIGYLLFLSLFMGLAMILFFSLQATKII